ncbi:MAG TPA: Fur family transcriptional regulator [Dehalococcoidales bacterium]|nr:Fur family transcriptional regulator [Dehalococcoidales bacterium]
MNFFNRRSKAELRNRISEELHTKGLRMTPQRLMIVAAIEESTDHISADDVFAQVVKKYPNVNISTVYRTLDLLEEMGLVTKTDLGGGRVRYHPAEKGHHHHLVCRECGKIIDMKEEALNPLKEMLMYDYQFIADLRHLGIWGRCLQCSRRIARKDG